MFSLYRVFGVTGTDGLAVSYRVRAYNEHKDSAESFDFVEMADALEFCRLGLQQLIDAHESPAEYWRHIALGPSVFFDLVAAYRTSQ